MEIVKTLSMENTPYDAQTNYLITFSLKPAIYDFSQSYINIPLSLLESYTQAGNLNGIANLGLGNNTLASVNIKNVKFSLDGEPVLYTRNMNVLNTNLNVYKYNVAQERLQEYLGGINPTIDPLLIAVSDTMPITFSNFRDLLNEGVTLSKRYPANLRVTLNDILGSLPSSYRDLRKYGEIILELQLANITNNIAETNPVATWSNQYPMATNTYSLNQQGITTTFTFSGTANSGVLTPTAPTATIPYSTFPFGVGDSIGINGPISQGAAITNVAVSGAGNITSITINPIIPNSIGNTGTYTLNSSYVPTNKQIKITGASTNASKMTFLNGLLNKFITFWDVADNEVLLPDVSGPAVYTDATVTAVTVVGADVVVTLSGSVSNITVGDYLEGSPLFFTNESDEDIPAGTDLITVKNFDTTSFQYFVGQALLISGTANVTPSYGNITQIAYAGNKANVQLNRDITIDGGDCDNLCAFIMPSAQNTAIYNNKWELVTYRIMDSTVKTMGQMSFDNKFTKWLYDADVVDGIATNGLYEKTFILEPLTMGCILCLTGNNSLYSDVTGLNSYRLLIDGVDTTSRSILLNSDNTFKYERLINGFNFLKSTDMMNGIDVSTAKNELSNGNGTYIFMQDIAIDGKGHKLTLSLNNGSGSFATHNLMLFKLVLGEF